MSLKKIQSSMVLMMRYPGDKVVGNNERCLLMSHFDAKKSQSEAKRTFDCHILVPVNKYSFRTTPHFGFLSLFNLLNISKKTCVTSLLFWTAGSTM